MTVYYITTENRQDLFDFYLRDKFSDSGDYTQNVKKAVGDNQDVKNINQRTDFFNSFNYLILDRNAFCNEDREVLQVFKSVISFMDNARPIFIWTDIDEDNKNELIRAGIKNLICSDTLDEQKEEIRECFSAEGMKRYNTAWKTSKNDNFERYEFRKDEIYAIQIMSTNSYIKSISIALSLVAYLNEVGANILYYTPFYTDFELNEIANYILATKVDENTYIKDKITISSIFNIKEGTNFIIEDLGFIRQSDYNDKKDIFDEDSFDKKIIVCDPNDIEISTIAYYVNTLSNKTILVNSKDAYIDISKINPKYDDMFKIMDKQLRIKKLDVQDDIVDIRTNRNFFYDLIATNIVARRIQ